MSTGARVVTVHRVADRHEYLHGRAFSETLVVEARTARLGDAVVQALEVLGLDDDTGKTVITVDWPHEFEAGGQP